jgi:transaldolase
VADTGDIESIAQFKPQDATTNPSLIAKAAQLDNYQHLITDAVAFAKQEAASQQQQLTLALDKLSVNFGIEILRLIPGRVSTEVDARLSFDSAATIVKAKQLIDLYQQAGVDKDRVLIKIAATWEGIQAAAQLEQQGIHCNLTLLFSFAQAVACASAGVTLISPFVGRIYDWYKQQQGVEQIAIAQDPGVASVSRIYHYYKKFDYKTQIMGASFRTREQIVALAGCDLLTISPNLLAELQQTTAAVSLQLSVKKAKAENQAFIKLNEANFRWQINQDPMATVKLAEGIRAFAKDQTALSEFIAKHYF